MMFSAMPLPQNNTLPPQGTKPEWLHLPKKPCENCGTKYKPWRPSSRFCCDKCKTAFHRNGGAFQKLKVTIGKEIRKQMNLSETCPVCKGKETIPGKGTQRGRRVPCSNPDCVAGLQLTDYGHELLTTLRQFLFKTRDPLMRAPADAA